MKTKVTKEMFFKLLKKTRVFNPRFNRHNEIRFDGGMCPITAVCAAKYGTKYSAGNVDAALADNYISRPAWAQKIIAAADNAFDRSKLRKRLIQALGL